MTFLKLVQRLRQECAVSGQAPATLKDQPADIQRLTNWVNTAWLDVQLLQEDWFFMRSSFSFPTVARQFTYTPVGVGLSSFSTWKKDSLRIYPTASGPGGETFLPWMQYDSWRDCYQFGSLRTSYQRPNVFSIDPQHNIVLGATPDGVYTINGEYYTQPLELVAETDVPSIPSQYQMLIVYRAMMYYGAYEAAPDVTAMGKVEFDKLMARLRRHEMDTILFGGPLA